MKFLHLYAKLGLKMHKHLRKCLHYQETIFLIRLKISYKYYHISNFYTIRSVLPIRNITSFFFFTTIDPPEEFQNSTAFPHLAQSNFSWGIFSTVDPYDKHTPDVYFPFFVLMEFIGRYTKIEIVFSLKQITIKTNYLSFF